MTGSFEARTARCTSSRSATVVTAVGALFLLSACGGGDSGSETSSARSANADTSTAAHTHEEGGDDHSHGEGTHTHAAADTLATGVALRPASGAAWSGSATLLSVGDSVRVLVTVEGMAAGSRHPVELVAGGCEGPGPVLVELTPLAAGSSGGGSSQTAFAAYRLEGHAHGGLRMLGSGGAAIACAPVHLSASEHAHEE